LLRQFVLLPFQTPPAAFASRWRPSIHLATSITLSPYFNVPDNPRDWS